MPFRKNPPLVVKIGSAVLADEQGHLSEKVIHDLVQDVLWLLERKQKVCLVSSGAILAGMGLMGLKTRPKKLDVKQALAAVGQVQLMRLYARELDKAGYRAGQILLTHEGVAHREGFINVRNTMLMLMEKGAVPIVNENDSVSTQEIRYGENDGLAVAVANVVESKRVIFLSLTEGLLDENNQRIAQVKKIDSSILSLARGGNSAGTGGMGSKLMAVHKLMKAGIECHLASGRSHQVLRRIFNNEDLGTRFLAQTTAMSSKKVWMSNHLHPHGQVTVDEGAYKAVTKSKASLLAPGILSSERHWKAGELISICYQGREFARGMCRMSDGELKKLLADKDAPQGKVEKKSSFVVHRNDIVILETPLL